MNTWYRFCERIRKWYLETRAIHPSSMARNARGADGARGRVAHDTREALITRARGWLAYEKSVAE